MRREALTTLSPNEIWTQSQVDFKEQQKFRISCKACTKYMFHIQATKRIKQSHTSCEIHEPQITRL